jgi:hypothetical protein
VGCLSVSRCSAQTIQSQYSLAFVYANGSCHIIQPPAGGASFTGIADDGDVMGIYATGTFQALLLLTGIPVMGAS